jgi:hypothetical protein
MPPTSVRGFEPRPAPSSAGFPYRKHHLLFSAAAHEDLSRFGHGIGVRLAWELGPARKADYARGRASMANIISELFLFSCFAAFVTGIVVAAAALLS